MKCHKHWKRNREQSETKQIKINSEKKQGPSWREYRKRGKKNIKGNTDTKKV
jgi:hypothetical protein